MSDARPASSRDIIAATTPPVDPTGVANLDLVLGGGLPRGALTLFVGPPGSGKTTLACQIAFAAAHAGRRVLLLTALSEPASKLIAHMRTLAFFDEALIGGQVRVLSLGHFLAQGWADTAEAVVTLSREERASLVVLDGFRGVGDAEANPQQARQFLYDVGTTLALAETTTLITCEADLHDPSFYPEGTTADAIIGLHARRDDVRQRRGLEVVKVRGAAPLPGLHSLTLGPEGGVVYPRLEARVTRAAWREDADDAGGAGDGPEGRARFDLPEFDALLGGGLTRGTPTLVVGSPGTGKTLLALHFVLAGARAGEPALFLGFHETRAQLMRKADAFALGPELRAALAPGGALTLLRRPPVELDPDVLADELLAALDRTGARRLVVDSVAAVERAVAEAGDARRVPNYLAALVEALQERAVTTLLIKESPTLAAAALDLPADLISVVAANVVWLQQVADRGRLRRVLSVPKMRYSAHDDALRAFTIAAPAGIRVLAPVAAIPVDADPLGPGRETP